MPDDNKTEEFLKKLAPCIERGDLDACVEEAARVAREMGVGAGELISISAQLEKSGNHDLIYVLALAAAPGLEGKEKAVAYSIAGALAAQFIDKLKEAEECFKKAIGTKYEFAETHYSYALLLTKLNRKNEAEEHFTKAISLNPKNAEMHHSFAILLEDLNKNKEAEEHYRKAIEINPNYADAYNNYGIWFQEHGRLKEAEEHYKKAIEINPKHTEAYSNYAVALQKLGRIKEAEECYKKAIEINPDATAHSNYAIFLSGRGRKKEAEDRFKKSIKLNPNNANAHGAYGLLLIELNRRKDSWKEFEISSNLFEETKHITDSHINKAWFYELYAKKNLERNKYYESSQDIYNAGEEYLKASETVDGEIKHALELKGNVYKAQSLIRKEHKTNQELIDDLKNASEFYKKASVCPASGTEETCGACYSVMEVFSQVLTALEEVVHNKKPSISKEEWNVKLEKSNEVYIKKCSKKGATLISALKELIKCVDELAYFTARKSSLQKKRLKECYNTLEDVSSKVEGGLRNITDPANEILKKYSRKMGVPMPEEKALDESPSPFYKKLIKPIVTAIITIILGYITNLFFEWKTHVTIWNFIKSTVFNQTLP